MTLIIVIIVSVKVMLYFNIELDTGIVSALQRDLVEHILTVQIFQLRTDNIADILAFHIIKIAAIFQLFIGIAKLTSLILSILNSTTSMSLFGFHIELFGKEGKVPHYSKIGSTHLYTSISLESTA